MYIIQKKPLFLEVGTKHKFNFKEDDLYNKQGVYMLFKNATDTEPFYVGMSIFANLGKTISRHFQTWNDEKQKNRIHYTANKNIHFRVYVYDDTDQKENAKAITEKEALLIAQFLPRDNKEIDRAGATIGGLTPDVKQLVEETATAIVTVQIQDEPARQFLHENAAPKFREMVKEEVKAQEQQIQKEEEKREEKEDAKTAEELQKENIFLTDAEALKLAKEKRQKRNAVIKKITGY